MIKRPGPYYTMRTYLVIKVAYIDYNMYANRYCYSEVIQFWLHKLIEDWLSKKTAMRVIQ